MQQLNNYHDSNYYYCYSYCDCNNYYRWLGGIAVKMLDSRSKGGEFDKIFLVCLMMIPLMAALLMTAVVRDNSSSDSSVGFVLFSRSIAKKTSACATTNFNT